MSRTNAELSVESFCRTSAMQSLKDAAKYAACVNSTKAREGTITEKMRRSSIQKANQN